MVVARLEADPALRRRIDAGLPEAGAGRRMILVTAHRRESFGPPFRAICAALARLAERTDVEIAFPLHPNPALRAPAEEALAGLARLALLAPLGLPPSSG